MKTEDYLTEIGKQEKQFDALYRNAGAMFGLPDCAMWVLYFLFLSPDALSQQDLIEKMMFPKQTVNSAVAGLVKKRLAELAMIPGTRNKKSVTLTKAGRDLADQTVGKMYRTECRAVERMGDERMTQFYELYRDFFSCLQTAFREEGLTDGTQE